MTQQLVNKTNKILVRGTLCIYDVFYFYLRELKHLSCVSSKHRHVSYDDAEKYILIVKIASNTLVRAT